MNTLFFSNDQITIYRKRRIGSTNRFAISATFTAFNADVQPASSQRVEFFGGRFGAVFTAFIEATVDIKENDQVVTISDNKRYSVKGVQRYQGAGLLDHLEVVLVAQDGY